MGRSLAPVASLNASAKRKPLSLKPERKNSPRKAGTKTPVCGWDKENQNNVNCESRVDALKPLKKFAIAVEEESEERKALRKRVEEAVAFHLAQRSLLGSPTGTGVRESQEESDEASPSLASQVDDNLLYTEAVVPVSDGPIRQYRLSTLLAVLLVLAMAVWSGVRVALLNPNNVLMMTYQPYVQQGIAIFTSKLDYLGEEVDTTTELAYVAIESPKVMENLNEVIYFEDIVEEKPMENDMEDLEAIVEAMTEVEVGVATEAALEQKLQDIVETEATVIVELSTTPQAMLQIMPPQSHTQLVLRKAFDILTPIKKVLAKIQDKLVHVMQGISRLFRSKAK